jgi:hypothetical protein
MLNIKTLQHSILRKLALFGSISLVFLSGIFLLFKNQIINYNYFELNDVLSNYVIQRAKLP